MAFRLSYPDDEKRSKNIDDRDQAVEQALREADEFTVEVFEVATKRGEDDVLLARYEVRDAPLYSGDGRLAPEPEPEPADEPDAPADDAPAADA
jgi:hypothetical protein